MKKLSLKFLAAVLVSSSIFNIAHAEQVTVMTYNAENFFDAKHDLGTNDYQYLPLSYKKGNQEVIDYCNSLSNGYYKDKCFNMDWNQKAVDKKIDNLARVIRAAGAPDIIAFQEVENENILRELINKGLKGLGYKEVVLIEGPDTRGIDVGYISKFPLAEDAKYHDIDLSSAFDPGQYIKKTRGVLAATFKIGSKKLTLLNNHWPSQRNDDETRVIAANVLIEATSRIDSPVIALGDFNTDEKDDINAIKELMIDPNSEILFKDVEKVHFGERGKMKKHRGTHYYRGKWSSLDLLFVVENQLNEDFRPLWSSYRVIKKDFMCNKDGSPKRYDAKTYQGFSDHLPAMFEVLVK